MIAVEIIGIVSALALPAYRGYVETANMTKVAANFEQSVRVAQNMFAKDRTRVAIGLPASAPTDTEGWIELLNKADTQAPGGGPAYVASTNKKDSGRGDPTSGAVGVRWKAAKAAKTDKKGKTKAAAPAELTLWRPLYLSLVEQRAKITAGSIEIDVQRTSL